MAGLSDPIVICENLVKIYTLGDTQVMALQGLDLEVSRGELVAIVGASGSGKTTLLNVLGGLDRPTAGRMLVNGTNLLAMSDAALNHYRRHQVGFIWQQTARNLVPYLSTIENVGLPMVVAGTPLGEKRRRAQDLLEQVGMGHRASHKLSQLSGGEQQRVAIAVALANRPVLLLADEPTGSLDSVASRAILSLFTQLTREHGVTTIVVTHDAEITSQVNRVVAIRDGKTSSERIRRVPRDEHAPGESAGATHASGDYHEYVVLDSAGRLQIPPEIREDLNIGDRVQLDRVEEGILIRPILPRDRAVAEMTAGGQEPAGIVGTGRRHDPGARSRWRDILGRLFNGRSRSARPPRRIR